MAEKTFYLTTPIYYVNDVPHIGHAYTTLACDMVARFMRLDGYKVLFTTGTDEHGQKNAKSAEAAGKSPKQFVDDLSINFKRLCKVSNFSCDEFIRTTEVRHLKAAQALWGELVKNGYIYLGSYSGWYSMRDEAYYAESELVNGKAPTGAPVEWVEEPSYFFKLSAFEQPLLKFYQDNPDFVMPKSRFNEVIRFVEGGLRDLSVSRATFNWGVPVPDDPQHVMYVWLDALTNYLTCVGYPDLEATSYCLYWPADVHMVGKDILRFHAIYWPAFLMAAGLPCPKKVYAHGWWTKEGHKISKSLGNTIDPFELYQKYGLDQVRYFMLREVPFGADGDFSHKAIVQRINSDLANDYGNLVQRVLSFIYKTLDGRVPTYTDAALTSRDQQLLGRAQETLDHVRDHMKDYALHRVLEAIWCLIGDANRYVDGQQPWVLKKTDEERMKVVLGVLANIIRQIALMTQPIMPDASARILDQLAIDPSYRDFAHFRDPIAEETLILQPQGVFPRWEGEE